MQKAESHIYFGILSLSRDEQHDKDKHNKIHEKMQITLTKHKNDHNYAII